MNRTTILCGMTAAAAMIAAMPLGCAKPSDSAAGYNPPPPKTRTEINQEIDANTKLTPQIKQMLKEQVASGASSGMSGKGGATVVPPAAAAYLKSSRAGSK